MATTIQTEHPHIVRSLGVAGSTPTIAGTRISVAFIVGQLRAGDTPQDILASYPHLRPAALYDAISFYYDHQDEIDRFIAARALESTGPAIRLHGWRRQPPALQPTVTPRLYLDEDVVPELARMLRSQGHDASSAHEVGALGPTDPEQLERASNDGRTLLTYTYHDFPRINDEWFAAGRSHAGIVISYRQYARSELGALFRTVVALVESLTADELRDSVAVLDQFRRDERLA